MQVEKTLLLMWLRAVFSMGSELSSEPIAFLLWMLIPKKTQSESIKTSVSELFPIWVARKQIQCLSIHPAAAAWGGEKPPLTSDGTMF